MNFSRTITKPSLKPDEIITEVFVPSMAANAGGAYLKFLPRTADDYATVSAAAVLTLDKNKKPSVTFASLWAASELHRSGPRRRKPFCGVSPLKPKASLKPAEKAKEAVDPVSDFRGSAGYKKEMAGVFVRRALEKALARYSPASQSQARRKSNQEEDGQEKEKALKFTQSAQIPVAREPLWNFLMDVPKVAQSLPGVESVSKIDDTTYQGALKVRVGPISLNLQGKIIVEEQDRENWRAALRAEAKDRMAAGAVNGKTSMTLKELGADQTELLVETDVNILGKIGEFGQPIIRKESRRHAQRVRREHQETVNWKVAPRVFWGCLFLIFVHAIPFAHSSQNTVVTILGKFFPTCRVVFISATLNLWLDRHSCFDPAQ